MSQYDFGFAPRPVLRLCYVEQILRRNRIILPIPSRRNLIDLIDEGTLEGKKTDYGLVVYEDSFKRWVQTFQPDAVQKAA